MTWTCRPGRKVACATRNAAAGHRMSLRRSHQSAHRLPRAGIEPQYPRASGGAQNANGILAFPPLHLQGSRRRRAVGSERQHPARADSHPVPPRPTPWSR